MDSPKGLKRRLGLLDSTMMMMGIVIDSGIFLTTGIMARDGLFFKKVARIHPRFKTPSISIFLQGLWACILTLSGTFEQLFTFAMFAGIIFWVAAAASIFALRKKAPQLPRPYKTWGYPVTPLIFIVVLTGILVNTLFQKPVESLAGSGLALLGVPVY